MEVVTIVYVFIMALGFMWVVARIVQFLKVQRDRDLAWNDAFRDEEFRFLVESVKERNGGGSQSSAEAKIQAPPGSG